MEPIPNETWRSCIRSGHRKRALLIFSSLGEAYVGQIARILGIPHSRVMAVLYGDPPAYSPELGLVTLGLVEERRTVKGGRAFAITSKGRRKARSIVAGKARRGARDAVAAAPAPAAPPPSAVPAMTAHPTTHASWSIHVDAGTGGRPPGPERGVS